MNDYFFTEDPATIEWLANVFMTAKQNGQSVRVHVDSVNRLRVKRGAGVWSPPIASDIDLSRDNS